MTSNFKFLCTLLITTLYYINVLFNQILGATHLLSSLSFHVLGYYSFLPFFGKPFPFSTFTIFFTILSLSISLFTIIIFINTKHLYITIYLVLFILDNKRSYATSHLYSGLVMICSYGCRPNAEPRKNIMLFIIIFVLLYFQFVINIYIFFCMSLPEATHLC